MLLGFLLYLGASLSSGAPAVAQAKVQLVSETQIEVWVKSWQKRLRLDDWKIETRMVRSTDLKPDTLGNLKWNNTTRTAVIKVLSPVDYEIPLGDIREDIEYTVVHELIHLQLSVLPRDLSKKDVEEDVVNRMADALMSLDKGTSFRARSASPASPNKKAGQGSEVAGRDAKP